MSTNKVRFKKGQKIMKDKQFCSALSVYDGGKHCDSCFTQLPDLSECIDTEIFNCKNCCYFRYCSQRCKESDWYNFHKNECGYYKKILYSGIQFKFIKMSASRFLFRLIVKLYHDRSEFTREYETFDGKVRTFEGLEGHYQHHLNFVDNNPDDQLVEDLQTMSYEIDSLGIPFEKKLMLEFYGKTMINSFKVGNAVFMCLRLSMFDHSCEPNAVARFVFDAESKKYKCYVKANRDIEEGEEIFLSYIKTNIPVQQRQEHLQHYYFFKCQCPKCLRELATDHHKLSKQQSDSGDCCPSSGYSSDLETLSPIQDRIAG